MAPISRLVVLAGAVAFSSALIAGSAAVASIEQNRPVEGALRSSPYTYFAYKDARYWGRPIHVVVNRLRVSKRDPRFAGAVLTPMEQTGRRASEPERVLLRRNNRWHVTRAQGFGEGHFACRLASTGVVRELFDGCEGSRPPVSPIAYVSGPGDYGNPTAAERSAIIAAARAKYFRNGDGCIRYHVRVSRFNRRYASVGYTPSGREDKGCFIGNGVSLVQRLPSGHWREKGAASEAFPCNFAPAGVIRSLFKVCSILGPPRA